MLPVTTDSTISKVAVVGVGRMGNHHARTAFQVPFAELVAVVDANSDRAGEVARQYSCRSYATVDELLAAHGDELDAVTVSVPTQYHVPAATPVLERKIACLVEKPLAQDVGEAQTLRDLAQANGAVLQVGHTERFNPAVRGVAQLGLTPRYLEVNRVSPMTFRSLDVGVVMDMMIHDLDIVLSLVRSPIARVDAAGVSVLSDKEDICNARIVFENGCVASITASRLALTTVRTLRLFSESAYVSLDYAKRDGIVVSKTDNAAALATWRERIAAGEDLSDVKYSDLVNVKKLSMTVPPGEEDQLTAQLKSLLTAAQTGGSPTVSADDGYAAVAAAERVVEAIGRHEWVGLDDPMFKKG